MFTQYTKLNSQYTNVHLQTKAFANFCQLLNFCNRADDVGEVVDDDRTEKADRSLQNLFFRGVSVCVCVCVCV